MIRTSDFVCQSFYDFDFGYMHLLRLPVLFDPSPFFSVLQILIPVRIWHSVPCVSTTEFLSC